jgi:hypothetical protein
VALSLKDPEIFYDKKVAKMCNHCRISTRTGCPPPLTQHESVAAPLYQSALLDYKGVDASGTHKLGKPHGHMHLTLTFIYTFIL